MGYRIGSGYKLSTDLQTTTQENTEVIPEKPENWTTGYQFYKFSIFNRQACHVIINGENGWLDANQGWSIDYRDRPIYSFIVVEEGISFNWSGAY